MIFTNEFYLVLIKNNGTICHDIFATSHKDLIGKYITPEDERNKNYFKATYTPKENCRRDKLDDYHLIINENYIPEWFKNDFVDEIHRKLNQIIESMIIRGRRQLLLHEGAILIGNSYIEEIKHSIIFGMYDNSQIKKFVIGIKFEIHAVECP